MGGLNHLTSAKDTYSHGLGGVQARHYDRHNYMAEKRSTLEVWNQHLQALVGGSAGDVIPMRKYR